MGHYSCHLPTPLDRQINLSRLERLLGITMYVLRAHCHEINSWSSELQATRSVNPDSCIGWTFATPGQKHICRVRAHFNIIERVLREELFSLSCGDRKMHRSELCHNTYAELTFYFLTKGQAQMDIDSFPKTKPQIAPESRLRILRP